MKSKTQNIDGGVVTCNLKHFLYEDQWKHEICETSQVQKRHTNLDLQANVKGNTNEIKNTTR